MSKILRRGAARFAGLVGLASVVGALAAAACASPALAATSHTASQKVALIPQAGPVPPAGSGGLDGIMPTSSYVSGRPNESFDAFSFTDLPIAQITPANLANYDTVALIQVHVTQLTSAQKAALAQFVANGGKLIIHDADETRNNDYSWLLGGPYTTQVGQSCNACGSSSGSSTILTNSSIISSNPADPSYVDIAQLRQFTDQGDSNLLVSTDPRWQELVQGNDGNPQEIGAQVAIAHNGPGLIIYNGFDTDYIKSSPTEKWRCNDPQHGYACPPPPNGPTVDWLAQMWYAELAQPWGPTSTGGGVPGLPPAPPVITAGKPIGAAPAGLPSNHRCVARRTILLRLARFMHMHRTRIRQLDVYLNRRHLLRERRPFKNRRLRHLPGHGRYTITVVATTSRGYHLIAKRKYRAC